MKKPDITMKNVGSISSLKRLIQNRDLLRAELNQDPRKLLLDEIDSKINSQLGLKSDLEYKYNYVRPSKGHSTVSWRTV